MKDPEIEEVQAMIEFLMGREEYVNVTHELCMIRRKISFKQELSIVELMHCLYAKDMIVGIKHREIAHIIFKE